MNIQQKIVDINAKSPTRDAYKFVEKVVGSSFIENYSEDEDPLFVLSDFLKTADKKQIHAIKPKVNTLLSMLESKKKMLSDIKQNDNKFLKNELEKIDQAISTFKTVLNTNESYVPLKHFINVDEYTIGLFIEQKQRYCYDENLIHNIIVENLSHNENYYSDLYKDLYEK